MSSSPTHLPGSSRENSGKFRVQSPAGLTGPVVISGGRVSFGYNPGSLRNRSLRLWPHPPNPLKFIA